MADGFMTNIITAVVLIVLTGTFFLPKKIRHASHSVLLMAVGLFPLLYELGLTDFTFGEAGIIKYAVALVVVMAAKDLIVDGIKVEGWIKIFLIAMGCLVIALTSIPTLHQMGALTFTIPDFPEIINHIIYIVVSIMLAVSIVLVEE